MSFSTNFFTPIEFQVSIDRLPNVQFFTQQASVPSISSTAVMVPTRFNKTFRAGDEIEFSNLELTFIVDEQMNNYREIFDWMISSSFPESHEQYRRIAGNLYSDISVIILNSKKNANINITYKNCFPISLGEIQLSTIETDITYPQVTATFQYDTFDINTVQL